MRQVVLTFLDLTGTSCWPSKDRTQPHLVTPSTNCSCKPTLSTSGLLIAEYWHSVLFWIILHEHSGLTCMSTLVFWWWLVVGWVVMVAYSSISGHISDSEILPSWMSTIHWHKRSCCNIFLGPSHSIGKMFSFQLIHSIAKIPTFLVPRHTTGLLVV